MHERMIATSISQLIRALKQCQSERQRRHVLNLELSMIRSERDMLKDSLCKVLKDGVEKATLCSQSTKDISDLQSTIAELYHKLKVIYNYASIARSQADHGSKASTFVDNLLRDLSGIVQTATALVELPGESIQNTSLSADPAALAKSLLGDLERLTGFSSSSKEPGPSLAHFFHEEDGKEQLMDLVLSCGVTRNQHVQRPEPTMPVVPLSCLGRSSVENAHSKSPASAKSDNTKDEVTQIMNNTWDGNYEQLIQALCRGDDSLANQSAGWPTPSKGVVDDVLRCNGPYEGRSEWNGRGAEYGSECIERSGMTQQAQDWATTAGYAKSIENQDWSKVLSVPSV